LSLVNCTQFKDLSALKGLPLTTLDISDCTEILDLSGLEKMPLKILRLSSCAKVKDLTPLRGMPLTELDLRRCPQIKDLTPLQGLNLGFLKFDIKNIAKGLEVVRGMATLFRVELDDSQVSMHAVEFRRRYDAGEFGK
jgi:hypothetical protein